MKHPLTILLILSTLIFSCSRSQDQGASLPIVPVRTTLAESGEIEVWREFSGGLRGREQADLHVRVGEAVTALPFSIGDQVRAGDVIVRLDYGGPSSQYYQAKATFENAEKNYRKMKYLFEEKAISELEYDAARSAYEVAQANFRAARELVEIVTPISGILLELNVRVGDIPQLGALAARVARIDTLRLSFGVPVHLVERFHIGKEGYITISLDTTRYPCRVTRVSSAADPQTRTFTIEASIPNTDRRLQAGTFAKARFVIERVTDALKVPQVALTSEEGVFSIFVVENDTARARTVSVGINNGSYAQILSGLTVGEEVVCVGQAFLSDGYPVVRAEN